MKLKRHEPQPFLELLLSGLLILALIGYAFRTWDWDINEFPWGRVAVCLFVGFLFVGGGLHEVIARVRAWWGHRSERLEPFK